LAPENADFAPKGSGVSLVEPFEFVIPRRPLSQQAKPRGRRKWQTFVRREAEKNWKPAQASEAAAVSISLMYLYEEDPPDVDNIPKPIIDALKGLTFRDDAQVTDLISRRRHLRGTFRELDRASAVLLGGFALGTEFVYVRVGDAPPQDELI
jgi:crossover junction endodeoxyribonuclease RusA